MKDGLVVKDTRRMIKQAQLNNHDIPEIVNGKLGYVPKNRPWDYRFTFSKIFRSWLNIDFFPFTRHTLLHKKVCHMLGNGDAREGTRNNMEPVEANYISLKENTQEKVINGFAFTSQLPVRKLVSGLNTEDEQVKALVDGKFAFNAGGQWCTLGFALLGLSEILRAQQLKLERDAAGEIKVKEKMEKNRLAKIKKAELVLFRFRGTVDKMDAIHWRMVIRFLLPMFLPGEAASKCIQVPLVKAKLTEIKMDHKKWDTCTQRRTL
jgi:hypothetical protein